MNFFDQGDNQEEEAFSDKPDEVDGQYDNAGNWHPNVAPPVEVKIQRPDNMRPPESAAKAPAPVSEETEPEDGEEENEDFSDILSDARLRLEQGRLYEMVMNHNIFEGLDADPKAVKFVQNQIREFAKERMEIMLGMRQEQQANESFPAESFPFNSLEVETLKALAAAATKGASREAEPFDINSQSPAPRTTLNPIGSGKKSSPAPKAAAKKPLVSKPSSPVKRAKANAEIQRILDEEGLTMDDINQVMDSDGKFLDPEQRRKMKEKDFIEHNRQVSLRNKRVENPAAAPMPSPEQLAHAYEQKALMAESTVKGWKELIAGVKAMPPTIATNPKG